jgi:membrane-associated phospholipid phosphatase
MRRWPLGLVLWLLVLAGAELVAFVAICRFFVATRHGQLLDTAALTGNRIGQAHIRSLVLTVLDTITALSVVVATAAVGFIALIRHRIAVAFGVVLLVAGANATTEILKRVIPRPELGVDLQRDAVGNSLPSGHTTIAASVAVALVLALPAGVRGIAAVLGAFGAAVVGVATLSAGWHRPSDAVAALLVVGGWASAAGVFIVVAQRRHGDVEYGAVHWRSVLVLAAAGVVLLAGAAVALKLTDQVIATPAEQLGRRRLLVAYAGGSMGIAGTVSLVMASVLATVHRVVPQAVAPVSEGESAGVAER